MSANPTERGAPAGEGPRVLVLGPYPPAHGGMVSAIQSILRSPLDRRCKLIPFAMTFAERTDESRSARLARHLSRVRDLWRVLRRERIDILYLHTCSGGTFYRLCVDFCVAKAIGVRTIWHIHGGRFGEFLSGLRGVRAKVVRRALASADRIVVLSHRWENVIRAFAPSARTAIVENAVRVPPQRNRANIKPNRFVFIGDLNERKGLGDLLEIASEDLPNVDLRLIGQKPIDQDRRLEKKMVALEVRGTVSRIGPLPPDRVLSELREASVFVLPSYAEGMPMSMLEAMAQGLPVVVTDVGAVSEVVRDGQDGYVIAPGDRQALGDRCRRLMDDEDLRRVMGRSGRQRIRERFDADRMAEKLHRVFVEMLERTEDVS